MREGGGGGGEVGERAGGTVEAHPRGGGGRGEGDFVCAIEERGKEDGNRMRGSLMFENGHFLDGDEDGDGDCRQANSSVVFGIV